MNYVYLHLEFTDSVFKVLTFFVFFCFVLY